MKPGNIETGPSGEVSMEFVDQQYPARPSVPEESPKIAEPDTQETEAVEIQNPEEPEA